MAGLGVLFATEAIGFETIGGAIAESIENFYDPNYSSITMVEETPEMTEIAAFCTSLLMFIDWRAATTTRPGTV